MGAERHTSIRPADSQFLNVFDIRPVQAKRLLRLSPEDLAREGIRCQRSEDINLRKITDEEGVTEQETLDKLAASMQQPWGQINRIVAAAQLNRRSVVYRTIDGFHRVASLRMIGRESVRAEVLYGLTDEETYDLRVLATTRRSVQYARVASWMQKSFEESMWAEKGLTLVQIFSLAAQNTSGSRLGLSEKEAEEAKLWAIAKAELWGKSPQTIWQERMVIDKADPDLVQKVRVGAGGKHTKKGVINPTRLKAIVDILPGEENFALQNRLANLQSEHNLDVPELQQVALSVANARDKGDLRRMECILGSPESVLDKRREAEKEVYFAQDFGDQYTNNSPEALREQINVLQDALKEANRKSNLRGDGNPYWWRTYFDLSPQERRILTCSLEEGLSLEEIAEKERLMEVRVFGFIQSAFRKYSLGMADQANGQK